MSTATLESVTTQPATPELKKDWRFYSGMGALVLAGILPLFSLALPALGLPTAWTAALVAVFIAGGPEVLMLVAAALMGKETMHYFLAMAKRKFLQVVAWKPAARNP